jgi:hypothetical protein
MQSGMAPRAFFRRCVRRREAGQAAVANAPDRISTGEQQGWWWLDKKILRKSAVPC